MASRNLGNLREKWTQLSITWSPEVRVVAVEPSWQLYTWYSTIKYYGATQGVRGERYTRLSGQLHNILKLFSLAEAMSTRILSGKILIMHTLTVQTISTIRLSAYDAREAVMNLVKWLGNAENGDRG